MTWSSKVIAAAVLVLMACIGVLSFWSEVRNEEDRAWVRHTYLVLETLQAIRIDIAMVETGQRGFVLTGQDRQLKLYAAGVNDVHQDMNKLADLIADNPRQREATGRLNPFIAAKLDELSVGVELRKRSGLPAVIEAVSTNAENRTGRITAQIAEMDQTEAQLLSTRLDTARSSTRATKIAILYGNAVAILILLVKGFVIDRQTAKRNVAERELTQANERLERRTGELSETNTELESFTYSVAHDLRAPLRHIAGYSNVLVQDYAPRLDAEGLRYLGKIEEGAHKMGRLVDDLLNLSRIGRQKLLIQKTPLDLLLGQVVQSLASECANRHVEWQIGELPSVECDPGLMEQVFVNLLSNAVKYTRKRQNAVIQVGQTIQNDEHVIFVRDNGVGFEMQYVSKLFGVFQRLHKASDFEGTGVGLAITQRIIRKHGGRIWAEAILNQGATFFFTIGSPEKESDVANCSIVEEEKHVA